MEIKFGLPGIARKRENGRVAKDKKIVLAQSMKFFTCCQLIEQIGNSWKRQRNQTIVSSDTIGR
jgi:hypothetical protein